MRRGATSKHRDENYLVLDRDMITHHDVLTWNLDRCVGCQLGPKVCPKDAISHVQGEVVNGRLATKLLVDVDTDKCIFCGMCVEMCPVSAISMTLNGEPHNPAVEFGAFPELEQSTVFDKEVFDWDRKDFVLNNCPTDVISYNDKQHDLEVDDTYCVRCRQCEVASGGAFVVTQPWEGTVILRREKCIDGCFACADVCPTRALTIDENNELILSDYYCIKCGACMQICPVQPEIEEYDVTLRSQGLPVTKTFKRVANASELPITVERWRVKHAAVQSGAWVDALEKLADDKA
ncbi:MAG: 4Fe-4S dicluster domain-containing protein, partial [Anaerolineales bacterium]